MLEKREALLHKKMAAELSKAKEFNRLKNKRAALQCLKKKKLYEQQVENLQNHQLKLEEQVITLEGSKTTAETFSALKSGAGAMKQLHRDTNIDDVDKVMDDINEQSEKMRQVQEALGQPVGYAADLDEDELDAELAELEAEDLEAELALEEEIAAGEEAVLALQRQTEESFSALQTDREALLSRNESLQKQMAESQTRLDAVREEAAAIIAEEQGRTEELETAYEETLLELEEKGGEGTLRPMLVEAQNRERAALDRVEELEKKLGELRGAK